MVNSYDFRENNRDLSERLQADLLNSHNNLDRI